MRFEGLDLNLLVAFDSLAEQQSVTAAARSLHLTQSAVSAALARLRCFFDDQLLIQNGRGMILTPKAESLVPAVREALLHIRSTITNPPTFEAETSSRCFTIIASDYTQAVLVDELIRDVSARGPSITFRILSYNEGSIDMFERGGVDVLISVEGALLASHPTRALFEDEVVAICWTGNRKVADRLSRRMFNEVGHVTTSLNSESSGSLFDVMLQGQGVERRVEVEVAAFSLMPGALIGTDRIAIMHRRFADHFADFMPIRIVRLPFTMPPVREVAQWHALRQRDIGLRWLLNELTRLGTHLCPTSA